MRKVLVLLSVCLMIALFSTNRLHAQAAASAGGGAAAASAGGGVQLLQAPQQIVTVPQTQTILLEQTPVLVHRQRVAVGVGGCLGGVRSFGGGSSVGVAVGGGGVGVGVAAGGGGGHRRGLVGGRRGGTRVRVRTR